MSQAHLTPRLCLRNLSARAGDEVLLHSIYLDVPARGVLALIGPAGSGKTTLLGLLNRSLGPATGPTVEGQILLDGEDLLGAGVDLRRVRQRVGLVSSHPVPFPGGLADNVAYGLDLGGFADRTRRDRLVERALKGVGLWTEDAEELERPADGLSPGELQLLCLARTLALDPVVVLLDHVTRLLDPVATRRLEHRVRAMAEQRGVVLVTHDLSQAARLSDEVAFLDRGRLVEHGPTSEVFTRPRLQQTEDYLAGRTP